MRVNKELLGVLNTLNRLNKDFEKNKLRIFSSNRIHDSKFIFFRYLVLNEELKNYSLRDILVNYFNKSEKFFPGSSYFLSKEIVSRFFYKKSYYKDVENVEKNLFNLINFLSKTIKNKKTVEFFLNVLKISGPNSTIMCNFYDGKEINVIKKNNSRFEAEIEESFINVYFNNVKKTTKTLQTCVLDAYVERESELMPIIDHSFKDKTPVLIFCRGISDNAIKSLKRIILRNNIFVYPYIIKFDNSDPFLLKDIAKALDIDILSAETGDSMYKDIVLKSKVKEVKLTSSYIEIVNPETKEITDINKKLSSCHDSSLKKYLIKRKARFSSNLTEILIPKSEIEKLSEIKCLIRCYNHAAAYGLVKLKNEEKLYSKSCIDFVTKISESMFNNLSNIDYVIKTE